MFFFPLSYLKHILSFHLTKSFIASNDNLICHSLSTFCVHMWPHLHLRTLVAGLKLRPAVGERGLVMVGQPSQLPVVLGSSGVDLGEACVQSVRAWRVRRDRVS